MINIRQKHIGHSKMRKVAETRGRAVSRITKAFSKSRMTAQYLGKAVGHPRLGRGPDTGNIGSCIKRSEVLGGETAASNREVQ